MAKKPTPQPEGNELALFPKLNLPTVTAITEEMNASFQTMYTRLEEDIAKLPTDMSDPKNRQAVASYAYRISRTKTALDEAATNVSGDAKKIVDAVNAERRDLRETLDSLRDKARARLDAWEEKEAQRKAATQQAVERHDAECVSAAGKESQWIADTMGEIEAEIYCEEIFGADNVERLEESQRATVDFLSGLLDAARKREAEQAELEQLRREKAEREAAEAARIAEEERKAREEAEAKRREEERQKLAQEAQERAEREAEEKIAAERAARAEAERRAKEAEENRVREAEEAKRRAIEEEEARKAAAARAEEEAKRREAAAAEAERQRLAKLAAEKEEADRARAADIAHRKKINSEAVAGLMKSCGLSEADAQAIVIAVFKGQVPHISISY